MATNLERMFIDSERFRQAVCVFAFAYYDECPSSPTQMSDWLMAEHVDAQRDNNGTCPNGDETASNSEDSREKLEDDVCNWIHERRNHYAGDIGAIHQIYEWLDRQADITRRETLLENPLHNNPYVGMVRGKQWERKESSDYYCGKCGWKVTDHDSYCPECGGALHKASSKPDSQSDARIPVENTENDASKDDIRDFDDSREKLEADARDLQSRIWDAGSRHDGISMSHIIELLDRQAAITRKTEQAAWIQQANGLIHEANARADEWKAKAEQAQEIVYRWQRVISDYADEIFDLEAECDKLQDTVDNLKAECDECVYKQEFKTMDKLEAERDELKAMNERLQVALDAVEGCDERCKKFEAERDALAHDLQDCERQRERLRQALGTAIDHAHEVVSLVNLDGEVIG